MNPRIKNLLTALGLGLVVVGLAAMEDWFGDYRYGADAIAYFDEANAMRQGDWTPALNPYWSIGYPLVLAAARGMFPAGWAGDWTSIHVVNLVIFVATYASFLYFVRVALTYAARAGDGDALTPAAKTIFVLGSLIFLEWQVEAKNLSRSTPDVMVSGLFFLLTAASLHFCLRPTVRYAILMGLLAGAGYVAKAVFLPLSFIVFATVLLRVLTRPGTDRISAVAKFLWVAPAMVLLAAPYVLAVSLSLGRFTLGESGALNYAWTVNGLTHWHWTGGPVAFGEPLHPIRLLCANPHVYEYAEPIHLTYPPWSNPFYWYEGYHRFFSIKNQLAALKPNCFFLSLVLFDTPHAPLKVVIALASLLAAVFLFTDAKMFWRRLVSLWPVYVPSLLGVVMYLTVCIEPRYLVGFLIILFLTPMLVIFVPPPLVGKRTGHVIVMLVALVGIAYLIKSEWPLFGRALHHETYTSNEQWQTGLYLAATGTRPGTKVAMVRVERGMQSTWAYVPGLHLVGQIGNQDFSEEQQQQDFRLFIDSPQVQQTVFDLFRKAGAELVVAFDSPQAPQGDGWMEVPGTDNWIHRL